MAGASGGFRRQTLLLAAVVSLVGTVAAAGLHSADAAPPGASSQRMLLRLHDLPPGYIGNLVSSETGPLDECDYLRPAEPQPKLAAFVDRYSPRGCLGIYVRLYKVPGSPPAPPVVGTGALDAGSVEAAEAGFAVAAEAISHLAENLALEEAAPTEAIGEATRLLHWKDAYGLFRPGRTSGSFLVWRSGSVLGTVFVAGFRLAADDLIAAELAHRQQAHIEHPTPYTAAERDSTEVPLDDPNLQVQAYWLGRTFRPGHGLPSSQLLGAFVSGGRGVARRQTLWLAYRNGISLREWTREGWKRFGKTRAGKRFRSQGCAESRSIDLPRGRAIVVAGYARDFTVCPKRPPGRHFAIAYIGGTVTVVELRDCEIRCLSDGGPYNSSQGARAVVRGLRLRPRTTY